MPNRVKKAVRPSASNSALSASPAALAASAARQARATWSACGLGAFQNTMTASPMNLSTVPPSARNAAVITEKYRDVCCISTSGSADLRDRRKSADVGEDQRDLLLDAAELGRDGIVDNPADDLLGNEMRERPYRSLRQIDRLRRVRESP